jgi:hypothetical protein
MVRLSASSPTPQPLVSSDNGEGGGALCSSSWPDNAVFFGCYCTTQSTERTRDLPFQMPRYLRGLIRLVGWACQGSSGQWCLG